MLKIEKIIDNKRENLQLILLADPSEEMVDLYLDKGDMFILTDLNEVICEAVVIEVSNKECELKNIATKEKYQGKGYGKKLLEYLFNLYEENYKIMFVGTTNKQIPFYNKLGFTYSHTVKKFFIENYSEPIFEDNEQCVDMIYLKKDL